MKVYDSLAFKLWGMGHRIIFLCVHVQVDIQKVWLLFSSVVLAFAFVFGNSIRQLYEAVIFLFVIHPYDVGDWLLMGTSQYQVHHFVSSSLTCS